MAADGFAPRRAAHGLILQVTELGRTLADLLPKALADLPPDGRARAQRLAADTFRWSDRADRLLGPHLRKRPPPPAMAALRMAVVEMAVHGSAPHGVVDAAVGLLRANARTRGLAGLVNAVLRRVDLSGWEALPVPRLPKPLRAPLVRAWGKAAVEAMERAHALGAPLDLTPRDGDATALAAQVKGTVLPTGSVRVAGHPQVTALPGYDEGRWWVQDAAAAIPARLLRMAEGERVFDLCAAPGGKTMQLAAAGSQVTAVDISPERLERVAANLARTGLSARLVAADLLEWHPDAPADAVLLDAPCSATGTIRRHPDLPHARAGADLSPLLALQAAMLDRAADMLRPGGRLVYCTCSLFPEEGEAQVAALLHRRPDLALDAQDLELPGVDPAWRVAEGLRLRPDYWPEQGGMDGFFATLLRKG